MATRQEIERYQQLAAGRYWSDPKQQAAEFAKFTPEEQRMITLGAQQQELEMKNAQLEYQRKQFELEQQQAEELRKKGLNPDGSPIRPEWAGITNEDGSLMDQYVLDNWDAVNPNREALDLYKQTALREAGTESPWAKIQLQKQALEEATSMDKAARSGATALQQAQSQLAQTGGISGSARERLAKGAATQGLLQRQGALRQGQLDRLNIATQDETSRMSQLGALQGMENQYADYGIKNQEKQLLVDQYNLQNRIGEVDKKRTYDLDTWKTGMQTWAANKQADAQAKSAKDQGGKK